MTGMAMRAVSYDKTTASVMGVPVDRIISITFAIGSAVAGAGGVLYSLAYPIINPYMGVRIGWWAFIAAVIGGIGNVRGGAMLGAYILAFVEVFTPNGVAVLNLQRLRGVYCTPYRVGSQTDRTHGSCYRSEGIDSKTPGPCQK